MGSREVSQGEKGSHSMSAQKRARARRFGAILAVATFAASLAFASLAFGADSVVTQTPTDALQQLADSPVYEESCTALCHANISATKNYANEIKFSHGNHILMQCSDCHARFPHRPSGTERPTMAGCFNCHDLRHGPRGILAKGECEACHNTPRWQLRPESHTADWAGTPHVEPGEAETTTRCMMCHEQGNCTTCHEQKGIKWQPEKGWDYDPSGDDGTNRPGCLTCHGNATLLKSLGGGNKSFQVTGVQDSAHAAISCQQCHPDYRYDDKPATTKVWNVNAGHPVRHLPSGRRGRVEQGARRAVQQVDSRQGDQRRELRFRDLRLLPRRTLHPAARLRRGECGDSCLRLPHVRAVQAARSRRTRPTTTTTTVARTGGRGSRARVLAVPRVAPRLLPRNDPESSVYPANLGATPAVSRAATRALTSSSRPPRGGSFIRRSRCDRQPDPRLIANIQGMIGGDR